MRLPKLLIGNTTVPKNIRNVVKNKIAYSLLSENDSNNAWNINSPTNSNNNNKSNQNGVRAVCALNNLEKEEWIKAYVDCRKSKSSSYDCIKFSTNYTDLWDLAYEVKSGIYTPGESKCFVITRPKYREIFAANFRDRIVQHWVMSKIRNFLEERFMSHNDVSYNCRKKHGTFAAVKRLEKEIMKISNNWSVPTYIGKFDLKSFFMSINKQLLLEKLIPFVRNNYKNNDIECLINTIKIIINYKPQYNCNKVSKKELWDKLPKEKSLFNSKDGRGLAIGNITSLELANFFMSFFDEVIVEKCKEIKSEYIRFVDDFVVVSNSKLFILLLRNFSKQWLKDNLDLTLHSDKFYIQEVSKGIKFIGLVIKPGRIYMANLTITSMAKEFNNLESICKRIVVGPKVIDFKLLLLEICSINSYLGFLKHNNSYSIKRKYFSKLKYFWKCCYTKNRFSNIKIKDKYNYYINIIKNYL